ncbi:MAG: hypothetical protein LLF76_12110 [Planctomycetaceae bacterium]|nr:hypothetical protein [Planctomycetaceae bacterium]
METKPKAKGSWGLRFFIIVLSVVLGVLLYWLLSFIENDIGNLPGPDAQAVRGKYVPESFDLQKKELTKDIDVLDRRIAALSEQKRLLNSGTSSLQTTISQLLEIQRQSLDKNVPFPEESRKTLQDSQSRFLQNQEQDQQFNKQISDLTLQRQQRQEELTSATDKITLLEQEYHKEFDRLCEKHRLKVAAFKLTFLVPVFVVISFVFMRYRTGIYWPLVWAAFLAAFLKITMVVHEYFPSKYFKYIAIIVVLAIVLRILVYLIRMIASPKRDLLLKQYQQEYDKCLCPVCSKPIRTGLLRLAGCLKKKSIVVVGQDAKAGQQEPYTCPSCGTTLYDKCDSCGSIRHSLLPYCEHCGKQKDFSTASAS